MNVSVIEHMKYIEGVNHRSNW